MKLTVNAAIFGIKEKNLHLLLISQNHSSFKDTWALPGGFILAEETLQEAIIRELNTNNASKVGALQHFGYYDAPERDPRGRIISVCYLGLMRKSEVETCTSSDASMAQWFPLSCLPTLAFDHAQMVQDGLIALQKALETSPIVFNFLDEKFSLPEIENIYQIVFQKEIDKRNFRKKLFLHNLLQEVGNAPIQGKGRPAVLYRLEQQVYESLQTKNISLTP